MEFNDLIELDNKPAMINSWVDGVHIWYAIRYHVLHKLTERKNNLEPHSSNEKPKIRTLIKYLYYTILKRPHGQCKANIIFFSSNVVNIKSNEGIYNRLYDDYYYKCKQKSIIIEDSYKFQYMRPRHYGVFYNDLDKIIVYLISKVKDKFFIFKKKKKKHLNSVLEGINSELVSYLSENDLLEIKHLALRYLMRFDIEKLMYTKLLKRIRPRVVFREDASYGSFQALAQACRDLNIMYAELQHGLIFKKHLAYNYGRAFFAQSQKILLPDYFFIFGKFWETQSCIPSTKIIVGYPYLNRKVAEMSKGSKEVDYLLISEGTMPSFYLNLSMKLAKSFPDKKVILRPHPSEREMVLDRYSILTSISNVSIDTESSIFELLANSKQAISSYSTTIFEAVAFGINIYFYVNEISKDIPGIDNFRQFRTVEELLKMLSCDNLIGRQVNIPFSEKIWKADAINNFDAALSQILRTSN